MTAQPVVPPDDIRRHPPAWLRWFHNGSPDPAFLARREAVRDILTSNGRTLAQGALAWIWARKLDQHSRPGLPHRRRGRGERR